MKVVILFLFFSGCSQWTNNNIQIKYNETGYNKLSLFVFRVIQKNPYNVIIRTDTLGLFCSPFIGHDDQFTSQWQFLTRNGTYYQLLKGKYGSFTGIQMNDSELYIHPPREGSFRLLQFCPHPLFYKNKKINDTWSWSFNIGPLWAIDSIYPVKEIETFEIKYKFTDTRILNTVYGELLCDHIVAVSKSKFGNSFSSFYFNDEKGLILIESMAANCYSYNFSLIAKLNGDELKFNEDFMHMYNTNNMKNIWKDFNIK